MLEEVKRRKEEGVSCMVGGWRSVVGMCVNESSIDNHLILPTEDLLKYLLLNKFSR